MQPDSWVLVLGASSGMGAATACAFAHAGYHVAGVHLDRRATQPQVDAVIAEIEAAGVQARFYNVNAADETKRGQTIADLVATIPPGRLVVLVHSLAFGALRAYVPNGQALVQPQHFAMTFEVMANSLVYWTQDLLNANVMGQGGRIFALTSAGSHRVWPDYGVVSSAKAALEAHVRQLAVELAPYGITANAIQAGVTDTPALRKVATHGEMMAQALANHPQGRLTTPHDVAQAIVALSVPATAWITGNIIRVDGGEDIVG